MIKALTNLTKRDCYASAEGSGRLDETTAIEILLIQHTAAITAIQQLKLRHLYNRYTAAQTLTSSNRTIKPQTISLVSTASLTTLSTSASLSTEQSTILADTVTLLTVANQTSLSATVQTITQQQIVPSYTAQNTSINVINTGKRSCS